MCHPCIHISICQLLHHRRKKIHKQSRLSLLIRLAAMAAQATLSSAAFATTVASLSTRKESATSCNVQKAAQFSRGEIFGDKQLAVSANSPSTARSAWRLPIVSKLTKGDPLPPAVLKDQDGRDVKLSKFRGRPLILYFYPANETPGCTKQACSFRDAFDDYRKLGATIVGVSGDTPESHKAFKQKYNLPYTLLSDEGNKLRKEFGVPADFFGALAGRQTYVVNRQGIISLVYNNQFQPEKHVDETLKILQT